MRQVAVGECTGVPESGPSGASRACPPTWGSLKDLDIFNESSKCHNDQCIVTGCGRYLRSGCF